MLCIQCIQKEDYWELFKPGETITWYWLPTTTRAAKMRIDGRPE